MVPVFVASSSGSGLPAPAPEYCRHHPSASRISAEEAVGAPDSQQRSATPHGAAHLDGDIPARRGAQKAPLGVAAEPARVPSVEPVGKRHGPPQAPVQHQPRRQPCHAHELHDPRNQHMDRRCEPAPDRASEAPDVQCRRTLETQLRMMELCLRRADSAAIFPVNSPVSARREGRVHVRRKATQHRVVHLRRRRWRRASAVLERAATLGLNGRIPGTSDQCRVPAQVAATKKSHVEQWHTARAERIGSREKLGDMRRAR